MSEAARLLIVTADDFGLSPSINAAVIKAHAEGILTGASLMVNGGAFEEAVSLARRNPGLEVGLHLSLVRSPAALSHSEAPALVDAEGNLPENPVASGFRFFFNASIRALLAREAEAQIRKFLDTGLTPAYLDGHLHFHVHPAVLEILLDLAGKYSIPSFRLPRENLAVNLRVDSRHFLQKTFYAGIYSRLCAGARKKIRARGISHPDHFFGLLNSGSLDEAYFLKVIDALEPGVTEIGTHPALGLPPELERWAPGYRYLKELQALTSPRVRERLEARGVRLAGYRCLQG
jgi:hopanoid biosynthesis associated protein HpnK